MLEKKIETRVTEYAKKLGWLSYKFTSPAQRGVPDRIYLRDGSTVFIEYKSPTGKLSRLQVAVIAAIRKQGLPVYVIASTEEGVRLFDSFGPGELPA